jgi:hypothetical protein
MAENAATLGALCRQQLAAITAGLALPDTRRVQLERFVGELAPLLGLDDTVLDRPPRWSAIGDDASPFEWSFVPGRDPDVRLLVEAQADPASPSTYWAAAQGLTRWCVDRLSTHVVRLEQIEDLYAPTDSQAYQACWHGFDFPGVTAADATALLPRVKVYLNPAAHGRARAPTVVRETLTRLGFHAALDTLGPVLDRHPIIHCSLDLEASAAARVKLYARVHSREEMAAVYGLGRSAERGDVGWLCKVLDIRDPWARTGFCVVHLVDPDDARPVRTVVNLPVADLVGDDERAGDRIAALLDDRGVDPTPYEAVLAHLAAADPSDGVLRYGRHSYLSYQRHQGASRLTVYLGARAFLARYGRLSVDPTRWWPSPVEDDGHQSDRDGLDVEPGTAPFTRGT